MISSVAPPTLLQPSSALFTLHLFSQHHSLFFFFPSFKSSPLFPPPSTLPIVRAAMKSLFTKLRPNSGLLLCAEMTPCTRIHIDRHLSSHIPPPLTAGALQKKLIHCNVSLHNGPDEIAATHIRTPTHHTHTQTDACDVGFFHGGGSRQEAAWSDPATWPHHSSAPQRGYHPRRGFRANTCQRGSAQRF